MKRFSLVPLLLLALTSCKVGPDYTLPIFGTGDDAWQAETSESTPPQTIQTAWWEAFEDTTLNTLVGEAVKHNHDVRIALAGIGEARALRRYSEGGFYPSLGADLQAEREGISQRGNRNNSTSQRERDNFDTGLDASWELDIFGGTRRATEAADARLGASREQYHDVMLSVLAETSRNYFEVRGAQKRIDVTKRSIGLLREVEALAESLFKNGATSEFDVTRARGEREIIEATLPNLEAEVTAGIYRLSVLTGKPPEHLAAQMKASAPLPMPPDLVPVGLRSDILRRRPDVRRAERELAAATADIGVATAELFPRLSLTGNVGSSAQHFSDLFTSGGFKYLFGPTLSIPLFEGGRARANIAAADARTQQALAAYEKTVLAALEDAESSLVRYGKEWETLKALQSAETTRKESSSIARLRYESGNENFLIILDAERSLISVQDDIIQSETRILTKLTQLYKSLGGGWETFTENPTDG